MPDNLTTQSAAPATPPANTVFRTYTDNAGVEYFPVLYITGGSAGAWTFQAVDSTAAGHGMPVQALDGALATVGAKADADPGSDAGTFSLMAGLKRLLARLTVLIGQLPSALTGSGNLKVAVVESTATQAVTVSSEVAGAVMAPAQVTVGTSAVQLDATGTATKFGVLVKALDGNAGTVYVGASGAVTTGTGYELGAGESVFLPVNNTNLIWALSSQASQKVSIVGV